MPTAFLNFIDGRHVESREMAPDINPSNLATSSASSRARPASDLDAAIAAGATGVREMVATTPQERFDVLDRAGTEILARKDELGRLLAREQGKPLADGIGEAARAGRDLQVLRRRSAARRRRAARFRRARASTSKSRASRSASSRRSRRGIFRSPSRRGRSRRRSPSATASSSSRRSSCRRRRGRSSTSCSAPACRRAC